jgi:phage repressor protein C with HTH and peptisase S24 domain
MNKSCGNNFYSHIYSHFRLQHVSNLEKAKEILRKARESKGWTQSDMAEKLGIGLRMYQKIEDGQFPKYKTENVRRIDELLGTSLYALIYETPEEGKDEQNVPHETFLEKRRNKKLNNNDRLMVPFLPVKAQAGYVRVLDQISFMETMEKYQLPPGIDPTGAVWRYFEVEGDSMEPEIREGDLVLATQVPRVDYENIRNFHVHIIVTNDRILIKRVVCTNPLEWVLISDNEERYRQQLISVDDVKEVWVLRRLISSKVPPPKRFEIKV